MTQTVRMALLACGLIVVALGCGITLRADGWERWPFGAFLAVAGFACFGAAGRSDDGR